VSDNVADGVDVTAPPVVAAAPARRGAARLRLRAGPAALVALVLLAAGCRYSVDLEPLEPAPQSSEIVAADGTVLTTLDAGEHRVGVDLDDMARSVRDAVVAIEDHRYWEHGGVDVRAVLRALQRDATAGEVVEGGSTITQQYVRTVMLGREQTVERKLREAVLAVQVEREYSKREILERYLNTVYFGNGAYGVEAAADRYFGTTAGELTLPQAALLAAMIRAPERYNPYARPREARARRDLVLDKLAEHGFVPAAKAKRAQRAPLGVSDRTWRRASFAPYFAEQVKAFVLRDRAFGTTAAERRRLLFQGGLRVETTLDPRLQLLAEDAVAKVLVDRAADPSAALVAIEPTTGFVKAYVGGRGYFGPEPWAKFDLASQARRQAGSAFKPFVLATALLDGVSPDRRYPAPVRLTIPQRGQPPWVVHNYDGGGGGELDLVDATVQSVNTVYAQLIMDVGPQQVVELASKMGVDSRLAPYPSTALGTNGVNALDLASAYATFAADGLHTEPVFVTRVTAADGTVLYEHTPRRERALPANTARVVNGVLEQVVTRGTGVNARIGRPVAAKTGTGEEWRDAWFVGSTPQLTAAVWVGFADGERPMVPPATRTRVTGGGWPAQIWGLFAGGALAETPVETFPAPTGPAAEVVKSRPLVDVTGMPADHATALLADAGYALRTVEQADDDYPPGTVLAQEPAPRAPVSAGSVVTLVVARTPDRVHVPSVLGMLSDEAAGAVAGAGLRVELVQQEEPPPGSAARAGRAWKQGPIGGALADEGDVVTVYVNP
jgi:penicillin-binding protein 1A